MRRKTLTAGENFTRKFLGFLNPNKGGSASDAIEPWSVFAICAFAAARDEGNAQFPSVHSMN